MTFEHYDSIVHTSLENLGEALECIQREKLWRGHYKSFGDYLASLPVPRRSAYRAIKRYVTEQELCQIGTSVELSKSEIDALSEVLPDYRHAVMDMAVAVTLTLQDTLTAGRIARVSAVLSEAMVTGTADIGDGLSTPLTAAVLQSETEAIQRSLQHVRDSGKRVYHGRNMPARVFGRTLQLPEQIDLPHGLEVNVSFWTEEKEVEHEA